MTHVSKERVSALSDGVIAIAATLLVLELKMPEDGQMTSDIVLHWTRTLAGWLISFAMVAIVWFESHFQMTSTSRWTLGLTVMTFLQLALLSLIPFGSNLIVDDPNDLFSALFFNGIMLANGLCMAATTSMIGRKSELHATPEVTRALSGRSRFVLWSYLLTAVMGVAAAALHHPFTGVVLWAIIPLAVTIWSFRIAQGGPAATTQHDTDRAAERATDRTEV